MRWWPRRASAAPSPAPGPDPDDTYELTAAALRALHSARMEHVDDVIGTALRQFGRGPFPVDVLLDIRRAMHGPMTYRRPDEGREHGTGDTR